jgi:hypothetical protein
MASHRARGGTLERQNRVMLENDENFRGKVKPMLARTLLTLVIGAFPWHAIGGSPQSAEALRAKHASLAQELANSPFGQPLKLSSTENNGRIEGEVVAVIDHPFDTVRAALGDAAGWCDILILHPNIKHCNVDAAAANATQRSITVHLGSAELPVQFTYQVATGSADYLDARLHAVEGPFGTTDYKVSIVAAPLDARRTVLDLVYAHGYGTRARLAMQTYLQTLGRNKVGFTVVGRTAEGQPKYIGDFRGGFERNAMRYYFAIEAYLDALGAPRAKQAEKRLASWMKQIDRYPRQLREEEGYAERKRGEMQRQQVAANTPAK